MKKAIILAISISVFMLSCKNNDQDIIISETTTEGLVIEITGLKSNDGEIVLNLTDDNEKTIQGVQSEIKDKKCTITITDLPVGKYAFQYFHDENSNDELDTSLGIPQEGYGFSNNAKGTFGPPKLEDMVFDFDGSLKMNCTIIYLF